jgi:hypothetical protein
MSKRFLVITAALITIALLGLLVIFMFIENTGLDYGENFGVDVTVLIQTNSFVGTAIASTATAKSWTATPTP